MPVLKQDNILNEYEFSLAESINARIIDTLKVQWYSTKYAMLMKQKSSILVPEEAGLDRSYLLKIGEIEGKMNMIQELFDDYRSALASLKDPDIKEQLESNTESNYNDLALRAGQLVD